MSLNKLSNLFLSFSLFLSVFLIGPLIPLTTDASTSLSCSELYRLFNQHHSLSPSKHPELYLKQSQAEAIDSLRLAIEAGKNKFLLVTPPGLGKTEILKAGLTARIEQSLSKENAPTLHILVGDQNYLSEQLYQAMMDLKSKGVSMDLKRWGDVNTSPSIFELLSEALTSRKNNKSLVLVTSIQNFKGALLKNGWEESINQLRPHLSTLVYDEAHHIGANDAKELIKELVDDQDSKVFLIGMTAPPIHTKNQIQEIFDNKAYWAYLDQSIKPTSEELVALDTIEYILKNGELPTREKNLALYVRFNKYKEEPKFLAVMEQNPQALKIFQDIKPSNAELAAIDSIEYILKNSEVPKQGKDFKLYNRFNKYKSNPIFLEMMEQNPNAFKIFKKSQTSPEKLAALDVIQYILKNGEKPNYLNDVLLYKRFNKYKNDPKFLEILKNNPQAFKIFQGQ